MDWYSWLSKTNLEPTFIHEYNLVFVGNELQEEDFSHFNHEFLQSIGIFTPTHRVEILKLAKKEVRRKLSLFSKLISTMSKTKKVLTKNISKFSVNKTSHESSVSAITLYRDPLRTTLSKADVARETWQDKKIQRKLMLTSRSHSVSGPVNYKAHESLVHPTVTRPVDGRAKLRLGSYDRRPTISGPIDQKVRQKFMLTSRSHSASGPLYGKVHEGFMYPSGNTMAMRPKEVTYSNSENLGYNDGAQSMWSLMFQDMKPT